MGWGVRAAGPATTSADSPAPAACSQNADLAAIRITSELARSEDPFVQAAELVGVAALPCTREHRKINFHQKNTHDSEDFFSCFCRTEPNVLFLKMNYHLRDDQDFTILTPNWPNSTSCPRGASGIQSGHNLTQSGSKLNPIG